jgi:hypothetical protein
LKTAVEQDQAFSSNLCDIYQCRVYSEYIPVDGQRNCPKHVEFHAGGKLVHLVGFIIKKFNSGVLHDLQGVGVRVSHNKLVMNCMHFDCIILQTSDCSISSFAKSKTVIRKCLFSKIYKLIGSKFSTNNCLSFPNHYHACSPISTMGIYNKRNQQDATLAVSFISHCKITCFRRFLCPSSGVLKTVVAATGHGSG